MRVPSGDHAGEPSFQSTWVRVSSFAARIATATTATPAATYFHAPPPPRVASRLPAVAWRRRAAAAVPGALFPCAPHVRLGRQVGRLPAASLSELRARPAFTVDTPDADDPVQGPVWRDRSR